MGIYKALAAPLVLDTYYLVSKIRVVLYLVSAEDNVQSITYENCIMMGGEIVRRRDRWIKSSVVSCCANISRKKNISYLPRIFVLLYKHRKWTTNKFITI